MEDLLYDLFKPESFDLIFEDLIDYREEGKIKYSITEVMLLALAAIICGAESWDDMVNFGKGKLRFLRTILPYQDGIPSKYTIQRLFAAIDHNHLSECLDNWLTEIRENYLNKTNTNTPTELNQIAIDGKTIKNARNKKEGTLHLLSAWCTKTGIAIAHQKVNKKANEITELPKIISKTCLNNDIITIDAIGCQKDIVAQIIENGGNYIIALKQNQNNMYNEVERFFNYYKQYNFQDQNRTLAQYQFPAELNGGRVENRRVVMVDSASWLSKDQQWAGIQSVIAMYSERQIKKTGKIETETRYFISSLNTINAKQMGEYIRNHWGIENKHHWMLDVIFNEDRIKIYDKNAATNIAMLRRLALTLLKRKKIPKKSIKSLKKHANWDNRLLKSILML